MKIIPGRSCFLLPELFYRLERPPFLRHERFDSALEPLSFVQMDDLHRMSPERGMPTKYAIIDKVLMLHPTPDAAYEVIFAYLEQPKWL